MRKKQRAKVQVAGTHGIATQDFHESIRVLVAGIVTGIAVVVLYQNVTGVQAGHAVSEHRGRMEAARLPVIEPAPEQASAEAPPRLVVPVPGIPVLPLEQATPIQDGFRAPTGANAEQVVRRAVGSGYGEAAAGAGVHVEIRRKVESPPMAQVDPSQKPEPTMPAHTQTTQILEAKPLRLEPADGEALKPKGGL